MIGEESDCSEDEEATGQENGNATGGSPPRKELRISDLLFDDEEDDGEEDQLLKELQQDPIFQISMKDNLTNFLQNFTKTEQFAEYAQHLNEDEKVILRSIQVSIWNVRTSAPAQWASDAHLAQISYYSIYFFIIEILLK